jgi:phenylacetate-CoA ligase
VAATSGTTGRRGIFLWNLDEWVEILASYNRSLDWAGGDIQPGHPIPGRARGR